MNEDPFTMPELFTRLRQAIWAELETGAPINGFRRNLQRQHLRHLVRLALRRETAPEDARTLARADLKLLAGDIKPRLGQPYLDAYTNAHLDEVITTIEAALTADVIRQL